MGVGSRITCHSCGFSKQFYLGTGMMHLSLEMLLDDLTINERNGLNAYIKDRTVKTYNYQYKLYGCKTCHILCRKPSISFHLSDGEELETYYNCSTCRHELDELDEPNFQTLHCPTCHEPNLYESDVFLWD